MVNRFSIFANLFWRFAERAGAQTVTFIVSIILARKLDPEVYGIVAIISVFTSFLQIFIDGGLGNALIQKEDADDVDFSSVFFFNLFICILLYLLLFFIAPFISTFFGNESICNLLRVSGLILIISGVKNIQQAYVSKNLLFKKFFYSTIGGTIVSAILGVYLAYNGFGAWALVVQQLSNLLIDTLILWISVKWRPILKIDLKRLRELYSFGWKLLVTNVIESIYRNMQQLIVGKVYSVGDLAYYNKGQTFPTLIMTNVQMSIDSVIFPVLSKEQKNKERLKLMIKRSSKLSFYIVGPLLGGIFGTAENLTKLLLTEKWLPCVPYMRIYCLIWFTCCISFVNMNAIMAQGRSDISLIIEIIKKIFSFIFMVIGLKFGVIGLAFSVLISYCVGTVVNIYPNGRLIQYGFREQIKDVFPEVINVVFMTTIVYLLNFLPMNYKLVFLFQVISGIILYILISYLFKMESFKYLLNIKERKKL